MQQHILQKIHPALHIDVKFFLFHFFPERSSFPKKTNQLIDFLLILCKSSIYRAYMKVMREKIPPVNYLSLFQARLARPG